MAKQKFRIWPSICVHEAQLNEFRFVALGSEPLSVCRQACGVIYNALEFIQARFVILLSDHVLKIVI